METISRRDDVVKARVQTKIKTRRKILLEKDREKEREKKVFYMKKQIYISKEYFRILFDNFARKLQRRLFAYVIHRFRAVKCKVPRRFNDMTPTGFR